MFCCLFDTYLLLTVSGLFGEASRPRAERFTNLPAWHEFYSGEASPSRALVSTRRMSARSGYRGFFREIRFSFLEFDYFYAIYYFFYLLSA